MDHPDCGYGEYITIKTEEAGECRLRHCDYYHEAQGRWYQGHLLPQCVLNLLYIDLPLTGFRSTCVFTAYLNLE